MKQDKQKSSVISISINEILMFIGIIIIAVTLDATILAGICEKIMNNIMGLDYSSESDIPPAM